MTLKEKILSILKLDDNGRIEKFFNCEIKKFNLYIKQLKSNIAQIELTYSSDVDTINNEIEDATARVQDCYEAVDIEKLKNNSDITKFSEEYWRNISLAETQLEHLNFKLDNINKKFKTDIDNINEQISKYQERISKLSS